MAEPPVPYQPGARVAEAVLQPSQIQDLADQIGEIAKAAVGLNPKFKLTIELDESGQASKETIARINQLLEDISDDLKFK